MYSFYWHPKVRASNFWAKRFEPVPLRSYRLVFDNIYENISFRISEIEESLSGCANECLSHGSGDDG